MSMKIRKEEVVVVVVVVDEEEKNVDRLCVFFVSQGTC